MTVLVEVHERRGVTTPPAHVRQSALCRDLGEVPPTIVLQQIGRIPSLASWKGVGICPRTYGALY